MLRTRSGHRTVAAGLVALAGMAFGGCTDKETKRPKEPISRSPHGKPAAPGEAKSFSQPGQTGQAAQPGQPTPPPSAEPQVPDPCLALAGFDPDVPHPLPGKSVVMTRVLKTCTTRDGKKGIERDTPWLAMGFPCTAGGGKVEFMGKAANPKMVSFIIATDCPMAPSNKDVVKKLFVDALGMPAESKLMAYSPFAVHFWEIPGMPDADTGFAVELRSAPALEGAWKRVKDKDKLRVRLFGRENAWVRGEGVYLVEADIHLTGTSQFALDVVSVKALNDQEKSEVKARCESLRTSRNCGQLF